MRNSPSQSVSVQFVISSLTENRSLFVEQVGGLDVSNSHDTEWNQKRQRRSVDDVVLTGTT